MTFLRLPNNLSISTRPIQVSLPENLIKKIQANIEGTSFKSVANFVESLVMQKFHEFEQPVYTAEEEEIIRERLRRLGYLE